MASKPYPPPACTDCRDADVPVVMFKETATQREYRCPKCKLLHVVSYRRYDPERYDREVAEAKKGRG